GLDLSFFFQAEDGIRDFHVTGVQTCALPIYLDVVVKDLGPLGMNYMLRMNWLQPPLDNVKIRRAILHAINQEDYLAAQIGDPERSEERRVGRECTSREARDL